MRGKKIFSSDMFEYKRIISKFALRIIFET
jgi:hypothetical protein